MSVTVGELVGYIRADDDQFIHALDESDARMRVFQRQTDGTLAEVEGDFAARGRAMGEALRSGIDETLAELHPEIPLDADPRPANEAVDRLVRRLEELRARVEVDVPPEQAIRELDEIQAQLALLSQRHADPQVRVDTGNALFTLDMVRSTLDDVDRAHPVVPVDVDAARALTELHEVDRAEGNIGNNDGPRRASGLFGMLGGAIRGVLGPIGSVAGQAGLMAGAIGAVIPIAAALIATLVNIAPAAAIGATGVFALASAFGAIKLGTAGMSGAFKAAFAPAVSGGGGAAKAANQTASAMRAVKDATQQAAYANQAAARQVSDAERNVADAQKAATQTQKDLNGVREQATRDLQDLNDQLADARLDERSAAKDVETALDALNAARQHGTGPGTDLDALQLAYDKAVQKLKEAKEQTQRLGEDTTKANKAGVDGSQAMVDARQKIADSNRNLADQERALSDARVQQSRTAAAGLESIQKAEEALAQAGASAGGGGGGVNKLATALAALSPAARAFVLQVIALKGAWTAMQQAVQEALFSGLAASLKSTATAVLPVLRTGLVQSAGALNLMAKGAMNAARNVARDGTLGLALTSAARGLRNLAGIPAIAIRAITQLAAAAGPQFQALTRAAGSAAAFIGAELNDAFKSGRMKTAIDTAVSLIKQIGRIALNVGSVLGSVFSAANASGGGFLNTLQTISGALATAFRSDAVQAGLKALFQTMALVARTVGPLLITALHAIAPVLTALAPPVQQLVTALGGALGPIIAGLGPILVTAAQAFGQLLTGFEPVIAALPQLMGPIASVVSALASAGPAVGLLLVAFNPFLGILVLLAPVLGQLVAPIGALLKGLSPLIAAVGAFAGQLGKALVPIALALAPVLASIAGVLGAVLTAVSPLLAVLGTLIATALKPLGPIFKVIGGAIKQLAPVVATLAAGLGKALTPVLTSLGVILAQLVTQYAKQFTTILQQLVPVIPMLVPVLVQLGQSLGQILLAIAPLLPQILLLSTQVITQLLPALIPLIPVLADMEILFLRLATGVITKVVIPVLSGLIRFMGTLRRAFQVPLDAVTWLTTKIAHAFEWLYDHLVGHSVIPDMIRSIVSWFAGLPGKAWSALSGFAGRISDRAWDAAARMVNAVKTGVGNAVSWLSGLPGKAVSALGDLSGYLYQSGQSLIGGFIDGITSMIGSAGNAVSSVLDHVKGFFPNSPAKRGPFSGSGWTLYSGIAVATDFAAGLSARHGLVGSTAAALMGTAQDGLAAPGTPMGALTTPPRSVSGYRGPGGGQYGAGGSPRDSHVYLHLTGSDEAVKAVRKRVRVSGGNVQVVLGKAG